MGFDEDARNWDSELRIHRAKAVAEEIDRSIEKNNALTAMEFGCGTGLVSFNLVDSFRTITLVDSSQGMIDILNSKIAKYGVKNMMTCQLDITDGSTIGEKFDVIYNSMVLHHIIDTKAIAKNFYELLNKDGQLCIVDIDEEDGSFHKNYPNFDGHNGFNQEALKEILLQAGFSKVEAHTFYYAEKDIDAEKIKYSLFIMNARK